MTLCQIESVAGLRAIAPAWDDLWQRSDHTSAMFRAEMAAQWLAQFASPEAVRILVVQEQGRLVAALPLAARRVRGVLPVADLPLNCWSPNGELLVDPRCNVGEAMAVLLGGLSELPWPLVWFDSVPLEWPHWQALAGAAGAAGWTLLTRPRYCVGQIDMSAGLEACAAGWSKSHRRNLRRDRRRLDEMGPTRLVLYRQLAAAEVAVPLRRAFELEDSGWKGRDCSSVLRTPGMFAFFLRQARQLAEWGSLCLSFLEHSGRPIAFEYGWIAKGAYYSLKIGYAESMSSYAPGHLIRMQLLEALAGEGVKLNDFCGPMTQALSAWSNRSYTVGRLILAPPQLTSRVLMSALRAAVWSRGLLTGRRQSRSSGV